MTALGIGVAARFAATTLVLTAIFVGIGGAPRVRALEQALSLPRQLEALGYKIAVYPLTLLNVSIQAMRSALPSLSRSERPSTAMDFEDLKKAVGFAEYYAEEARYGGSAARPERATSVRPRSS